MNDALRAFEARGLDIEIADKMGCRFERSTFLFEYRDMDEVVATKYRTLEKKFWFSPGMPDLVWNIDSLRELGSKPDLPLVYTEGEFDCIAVMQACGGYSVSVPNGASGKRSGEVVYPDLDVGYRYLWNKKGKLHQEFDQFSKIILATDADEKGFILRDELAARLGLGRCWFVEYPSGCKDANDVLLKYGEETLRKLITDAKPIRPGCLVRPFDLPPRETSVAYSSGWKDLDKHLMVIRPELMVISGVPGAGKSQWMRSLTFHLAESLGWKIAYLTPEDPGHRLKRDMIRFAGRGWRLRKDDPKWINDLFLISHPPEDDPITIDFVMGEIDSAVFHHDCKVFVIDPWNEISHDRGKRTDTEYIEQMLVDLKRKARKYNILLIIVAHPRKIEEGKKATLYDISGSSNWKNKADHGIIIHRPFANSDKTQVIVEKCKDFETMGIPGEMWMKYNKQGADFFCLAPETDGSVL